MVDKVLEYMITAKNSANQMFDTLRTSMQGVTQETDTLKRGFVQASEGMTDLMSSFGAVQEIMGVVGQAYNVFVGGTMDFGKQVKDLSRTIGATAVEASMLIQAADDMEVSYESLTVALETAIRKGVEPSIEGIGRLADQYNSIKDPIAQTRFLMDNFGRSGAELGQLMAQGSDGIRQMGQEAKQLGQVLDDIQLEKLEAYRQKLDGLTDKWDAFVLRVGPKVIEFLSNGLDGFDHLSNGTQNAIDAYKQHEIEVARNAKTYSEFTGEMMRSAQMLKEYVYLMDGSAGVNDFLSETLYKSTKAQFEQTKALQEVENQYLRAAEAAKNYTNSVPVMGHGQAYKAGQGPKYAYSESNPTGYVLDPQTGAKSYPGRASGGPMFAGIPRVVGEQRAEVFTPDRSGFISPDASAGGGGATVNLTVNFQVSAVSDVLYGNELRRKIGSTVEDVVRDMQRNGKV